MPLYHYANLRLGPGSIIEPGNWGRLLRRYSPAAPGGVGFGNSWLLARELIFEQLRPSSKPSRLSACFALPSRDDANKYRQFHDKNLQQILHIVELVDPTALQHTAGLSFADMADGEPFLDRTQSAAKNYWAGLPGDQAKGSELLAISALRVVRALE